MLMPEKTARRSGPISLWRHHPLRIHIATLFTLLILVACSAIALSNYIQSRNMVIASAVDLIDRIHKDGDVRLRDVFGPIESLVTWMSNTTLPAAESGNWRMVALADVLARHRQLAAVYIGYDNGDFVLGRALRDDASKKSFRAPQHAAFLLQSIERSRGSAHPRFALFDGALQPISEIVAPDFAFDPRIRPWYVDAMKARELVVTSPYVFFTTREIGLTIARRAWDGRAVVGADVELSQLSETLKQVRPTLSSELAIYDADGHIIAYSNPARVTATASQEGVQLARVEDLSPVLHAIALDPQRFSESSRIEIGGREWLVKASTLSMGSDKLASFAIAAPLDELLVHANAMLRLTAMVATGVIVLGVLLAWLISRRIAGNLRALTVQAAAIRRFDFADQPLPHTRINEIFGLGRAMAEMRGTIRKFLEITTALASERNFGRLLTRVLTETIAAAGAKGGVIYLLDDEGHTLKPAAQVWDGNRDTGVPHLADVPLQDAVSPIADATRHTTTTGVHMLPGRRSAELSFLEAHFGERPVTLVSVPLPNRAGDVVGVLCLFLADVVQKPSPERLALVEAFAGAGAAAIDNQRLLVMQKALLESLIALVAGAIDAKSPYTGGHCQRVPELTKMLARAACDAKTGPFAEFDMNEQDWEALHIAAWLHDCGKVTTPEYVVDKATKLETIYNRIHEIRMRFEVLKRDAEISCLKAVSAGGDPIKLRAALDQELRTLDEEFAFVTSCNEGGEFMADEALARLNAIAERTWQRTLDDRLGLSHEEAKRMARVPRAQLPATEHVIADRPEHVIERGPQDLIPEDNPWGFKLQTPLHLYNRGELYNLCVARGTLTEEERYKINDHITQTIIMLRKLPFPKHLRTVPELAGGHHEKMNGTGYPKRLLRCEMSVQARIMAIADIFEALTATDRPYKEGKMLSEAIRIMSVMKRDHHIDPDLFDLFLESGVCFSYAQRYMEPHYIDEANVDTGQRSANATLASMHT